MAEVYTGDERRHVPRTPASEISYQKYGKATSVRMTQVTVTTTEAQIVPSNPNRVSLLLVNNSASNIYIGFEPGVNSDFGVIIAANGGTFDMNINDEGEAVCSEIYGVCGAVGQYMTLVETIIEGG